MKLSRLLLALLLAFGCFSALAEEDWAADEQVYVLNDEGGMRLTSRAGRIFEGDEYITRDDLLYRVIRVDDAARTACATLVGEEPSDAAAAFGALAERAEKRVAMYSTHSDESYIPGDGESSLLENAGIYDVGEAFRKHLEEKGVKAEYSHETFFPHDAGAYKRSRSVAAQLLKSEPDALIDIHRDGIPASEYETEVKGEETSMVRLFVGRTNANAAENRAFAKKLKAIADEKYPGLIKDIFIGKGNYNQDLYPQAILLEFGTHEIEKEKAIDSTEYMADVVCTALYGQSGSAKESKPAAKGAGWLIALAVLAAAGFALVSTGSFRGAGGKMKRTLQEVSGGLFGKKKQ